MNNIGEIDMEEVQKGINNFGKLAEKKYGKPTNSSFKLKDRTWPDKDIEKAPTWCSVDLRDGNQALERPMTVEQKLELFSILVQMGFKEIEVGFPGSSKPDYDFIRKLIDENLIPKGIKIQVLTSAVEDIIKETRECLEGAKDVIVHLYNPTSETQRRDVFKNSKEETIELAKNGVDWVKKYFGNFNGNCEFQYSPESFTGTEIDFAIEICDEVKERCGTFFGPKIIMNLPMTVGDSYASTYGDKIEYMKRHFSYNRKDTNNAVSIILSVHAHNDRGSAISATENAIRAGADRVEGTLFGNGERTGNTPIEVLGLNMFTQGVPPGLNLSFIGEVKDIVAKITNIPIPERYPYAGELAQTAFSGGHQFAIKEGLKAQKEREKIGKIKWNVPYLPIDPKDIGLNYEPRDAIKINSQSGSAAIVEKLEGFGYIVPKNMKGLIYKIVQEVSEGDGGVLENKEILKIFKNNFVNIEGEINGNDYNTETYTEGGEEGPLTHFANFLEEKYNINFKIIDYSEHGIDTSEKGIKSTAGSYIKIEFNGNMYWGVGEDVDLLESSRKGLISALNIAMR